MLRLERPPLRPPVRRPHPPRLPPRRGARPARASRSPAFERAKAAQGGAGGKDGDVNCIMLMLVGGPASSTPGTPSRTPRPRSAGRSSPPHERAGHRRSPRSSRAWPRHADKFSLIRSLYHTATAVHDTGYQMMQTGPAVQRRRRAPAHGLRARLPQGRPRRAAGPRAAAASPSAGPAATCRTANTAGYLGKQYDPFILNADPAVPNFQVPDLLPPEYLSAVRAERRQQLRDAVDGATGRVRDQPGGEADGRQLRPGVPADVVGHRPATRSPWRRSRTKVPRPLRPDAVRPELPDGPPADRGGRAVRHGQHVRDGVRRGDVGHPRVAAVHRHRGDGEAGGPELRPGVQRAAGGPGRARAAVEHDGGGAAASSGGRRRSTRPAAATTTPACGRC